jgi:AraC family transcriptional regulator
MKDEYISRINRVLDFVDSNVDGELNLGTLSRVAGFSPSHFHRIFAAMVGETLQRYVQRIRVERAASRLVHNPKTSVTEIALDCGFSSPASFARAFKTVMGMSATEWREGGYRDRKIRQADRNMGEAIREIREAIDVCAPYIDPHTRNMKWRITMKTSKSNLKAEVEVRDFEPATVAYVRHTGPYQGAVDVFTDMFTRLMNWAGPRDLLHDDSWVMAVYHDNPSITDDGKLRVSACIDVPPGMETAGDVGLMSLDGGKCAVARFELGPQDYGKAWFALAGGWLPDSGYEPDDRLPFERYPVGVSTTSATTEVVDIYFPVRPLRRH